MNLSETGGLNIKKQSIDKLKEFINNITPSHSPSLNDVVLFEGAINSFKKNNLLNNSEYSDLIKKFCKLFNPQINFNEKTFITLKEKLNKEYRLKNIHCRQHSPWTCSIVCYLMAANIFNKNIKPNKLNELKLFNKLKEENGNEVELYNIIKIAIEDGFFIKVYSQFDYKDRVFDDPIIEKRRKNYIKAIDFCKRNSRFKEYVNRDINVKFLISLLKKGESILINGTINHGKFLHMRLACGYKGDNLIISDPLCNYKEELDEKNFEDNCTPPFGKWCLSLSNKDTSFYDFNE
jgi:hypothetical protein